MVINITDTARLQIEEMMKEEEGENIHLRFGVKGGGCSGLSYAMGFEHEVNEELDTVENANGIPLVIQTMDIPVVKGTTIDFKQNMMGGGFTIDNPNAIISCGCGSSFKAAEREGVPEEC